MNALPDIVRALDAVEADPFVLPPRGRGRGVGADPLLEHRIARIVYADDELLDDRIREAFRDYPRRSPGLSRVLDTLRLLGIDREHARQLWREREAG